MNDSASKILFVLAVVFFFCSGALVSYLYTDNLRSNESEFFIQKCVADMVSLEQGYREELSNLNQTHINQMRIVEDGNIAFFRDYSMALNDLYVGSLQADYSNANYVKVDEYTYGDEYYYEGTLSLFSTGKNQCIDAGSYLANAKNRLGRIGDSAPNDFFKEDVTYRIEQVTYLMKYAEHLCLMLDYLKGEVYEVNYGTEEKASEYNIKRNAVILEHNKNLKDLSDVNDKIDTHWDKNWYKVFQETAI